MIDRRDLFRRNPLFRKFTDAQLDQLVAFGRVEHVKAATRSSARAIAGTR